MSRCDHDALFYRVFCVMLLAIAFTFTIILTNVFIDIDGLLGNKQAKYKPPIITNDNDPDDLTSEKVRNDDINYGDNVDSYRTKRSIETPNMLFHIKDPNMKKVLSSHLSSLLDALEDNLHKEKSNISKSVHIHEVKDQEEEIKGKKDDEILHLTLQNILLQGMIGHMSIDEVHKRMNLIQHNLNYVDNDTDNKQLDEEPTTGDKLMSDLINLNLPQENTAENRNSKNDSRTTHIDLHGSVINPRVLVRTPKNNFLRSMPLRIPQKLAEADDVNNKPSSNVLIKTVIDIKSMGNSRNDTTPKENIQGVVDLIYNGQSLKFSHPDVDMKRVNKKPMLNIILPNHIKSNKKLPSATTEVAITNIGINKKHKDYINRFVTEYLKQFPHNSKEIEENSEEEKVVPKRLKRFINIKFDKQENNSDHDHQIIKNKEEDDLYVEIETHIDSKGIKGEKKKQIIDNLIKKIKKAIRSDEDQTRNNGIKKKSHRLLVKKRMQNPIAFNDKDSDLSNKHNDLESGIPQRELNPIPLQRKIPQEFNTNIKSEDYSNQEYTYLAKKRDNSAEAPQQNVNYNNVMDFNNISQRMQTPLNTDVKEESLNNFYDYGNMKFYIKDIDGAGFSIGFNQYVDEPPDPDTINLYSGLENILKSYHQSYDLPPDQNENFNAPNEEGQEITANRNDHVIVRRASNEYNTHTYNFNYDGNFPLYANDKLVYDKENFTSNEHLTTNSELRNANKVSNDTFIIDENIFDKDLKPPEILSLSDLIQRKKRSMNLKKITNVKSKYKGNKYINTKAMSRKKIFYNRQRNKRQANMIRVASLGAPHKHTSDENVFVISDDNAVFSNRAVIKEFETAEFEPEKTEIMKYIPYQAEEPYKYKVFEDESHHNALMSKYPHIFMEEVSQSKEDFHTDNTLLFNKLPAFGKIASQAIQLIKNNDKNIHPSEPLLDPKPVEPIVKMVHKTQNKIPIVQTPKAKYKVKFQITPKNLTYSDHTNFKEIRTSINKTYNKNGLRYSTLVNVSEISEVSKINNETKGKKENSDYHKDDDYKAFDAYKEVQLTRKLKDQQDKIKHLLQIHKKNINNQLNQLKEERSNLESILVNDDIEHPRCQYQEAYKLLFKNDNVGRHFKEPLQTTTTLPSPTLSPETTLAPITQPTTTTTISIFNEKLKKNLMSTIERHENITDQIMKKIDRNTKVLQTFLNKLIDKIEPLRQLDAKSKENETQNKTNFDSRKDFAKPEFPNLLSSTPLFLNRQFFRPNDSDFSIPFVYAMQQPIMRMKGDTPMASLVFQGHIHASRLREDAVTTVKEKQEVTIKPTTVINNTTLEELENLYRIIPVTKDIINKQKN